MPLAVIKFVISSSESEPGYTAENLLRFVNKRTKWKGKAGATQNVVVLQLDREYLFATVDIGNEYSALIEILVSRSSEKNGQFYTIVPSTSFMTLTESRSEKNGNRVRMFSDLEMVAAVAKQKWDVVKIVCTQPFNKNLSYGLSFVNISTTDESTSAKQNKETVPKIKFKLKQNHNDPDSSFVPGTMFKQRRSNSPSTSFSVTNTSNSTTTASTLFKKDGVHNSASKVTDNAVRNTCDLLKDQKKPTHIQHGPSTVTTSMDTLTSPDVNSTEKNKDERKRTVVFEKILDGVTICMSGYENPLRGVLREKALEMGAAYRSDWTGDCTHLICAFPNTPKWRQVRSKGQIVTGKWIEKCYEFKKRLPEQKFLCR